MTVVFGRRITAIAASALAVLCCNEAAAYRPFDGTDAAVAEPDTVEVELGPAEYVHQGDERLLIAPNVRLNYGVAKGWEAVLEGQTAHGLSAAARHTSQIENGFFLKGVLREGALQDQPGPSIAAEFGVILPGSTMSMGPAGASPQSSRSGGSRLRCT